MIVLNKGNSTNNIVVTLSEKKTIPNANYLFVFEHLDTETLVSFVLLGVNDISPFPSRYNEWVVNTTLFSKIGQYNYRAYEQVSSTNTDPTGLNEVENGKAELITNTPLVFTTHEPVTQYITHG